MPALPRRPGARAARAPALRHRARRADEERPAAGHPRPRRGSGEARRGREFPNEHLDAFFNATVDAALALGAFVSAAELAGLGTCPISQIRDHAAKVDELLALPDWVVPVAGLALGYPEAKEPLSGRLSLSATVHTDRYDRAAVERELDAYDSRRGRDWSGDKVRQYSTPWRADFGAFVERKRFRLV